MSTDNKKNTQPSKNGGIGGMDEFITGNRSQKVVSEPVLTKKGNTKSFAFSMPAEYGQLLDECMLKATNARVNRSLLVRIALDRLAKLPDDEFKEVVMQYIEKDS